MAVEIKIDTGPLANTFDRMIAQIDHFKRVEIGMALSEFQTSDMHRHRPFTMRARRKGTATTIIRPHSLYEMVRSQGVNLPVKQQRRIVRGLRSKLGHPLRRGFYKTLHQNPHWSTRPILRSEMYAVLQERLMRLLEEKITWTSPFKSMYPGIK